MSDATHDPTARFVSAARQDFERRLARAVADLDRLGRDPRASPALAAILGMPEDRRLIMFGNVLSDVSGGTTLAGMAAILDFVGSCLADDGACRLVPYVPPRDERDVFFSNAASFSDDQGAADDLLEDWLAGKARLSTVEFGEDERGRTLSAADLVGAVAANDALLDAEDAEREDFLRGDAPPSP